MAKKSDTTFFENKLLDFVTAKDPMLEMLQWVMDKFMKIEVAAGLKGDIYHKIQINLTYNSNHLESASSILLGSLVMGQKISTLSGGENVRIKILRAWKSSSSVLGIDEPFRGLNKTRYAMLQII